MDYSAYVVPLLLAFVALFALAKRVNVYEALTRGASQGLSILGSILPALVGLMTAVYMLRASGAMEALGQLLAPVLIRLGIPPETASLLLIRPVSGSGALAVGSELMSAFGPDSYIGRVAAVMLGSSETTFYAVAVYFGAAGIHRTRYAIPAALIGAQAGFPAAPSAVRVFLGGHHDEAGPVRPRLPFFVLKRPIGFPGTAPGRSCPPGPPPPRAYPPGR